MEFLCGIGAKLIQNENIVLLLTIRIVLASLGAITESLARNGNMDFICKNTSGIFCATKICIHIFLNTQWGGRGQRWHIQLNYKKYMQDDRKTRI